jgi:tetratricopeptide (TPR) repeat protein
MPGAFAYHLHSFSAASLRTPDRNWVGPLLAKGATISMGSVAEPYLAGTPDVAIFAARLLFNGMTFGEAAYAGQSLLSWQTTIIGDPLFRPSGKPPQQLHEELERRHSKLLEWSHLRVVNLNLVRGSTLAEVVNYLEQTATTTNSAVLTEKLADLYVLQGKPASAIGAYERALKLEPSPQQRLRLRLTFGEKLAAANRDEDAYANYEKLLAECSDYPDKLSIYRRLLPLAQKLGKKEAAARFEENIKGLGAPAAAK